MESTRSVAMPKSEPEKVTTRRLNFSDTTLASGLDISGTSINSLNSAGDNPLFNTQPVAQQHYSNPIVNTEYREPVVGTHKSYPVTSVLDLHELVPPVQKYSDMQDSDGFSPDTREFLDRMNLLRPV
eukprot:TRINITY_DN10833_c0_g1_i3.p1 TRINITY_DN10833_c0_g1~~TRINITY_DN10833_c0_g1_i3.p1  ORF type:complete len:127 (+),score=21.71 TRINITY_DN10833_c0_g1_i3:243-623(+)